MELTDDQLFILAALMAAVHSTPTTRPGALRNMAVYFWYELRTSEPEPEPEPVVAAQAG